MVGVAASKKILMSSRARGQTRARDLPEDGVEAGEVVVRVELGVELSPDSDWDSVIVASNSVEVVEDLRLIHQP
jgi:hypothetical protein